MIPFARTRPGSPADRRPPAAAGAVAVLVWLTALAAPCGPAAAAEIRSIEVAREGGRYVLDSHTVIEAPRQAVFDVLSDFDELEQISSVFEETRTLSRSQDGQERIVYTRARGCVMFFCTTIERYEQLSLEPPRRIVAKTIPPRPELRARQERREAANADAAAQSTPEAADEVAYARQEWRLSERPDGTHVYYDMELEPDFWIPPLIGPWAVKRRIASGVDNAAERLEQLARQRAAPPRRGAGGASPQDAGAATAAAPAHMDR